MYGRRRGRGRILNDLRKHLTMNTFGCNDISGGKVIDEHGREWTATEFVRERTRVWRDSWIFPLIDELEAKEPKKGKRDAK